MQRKKKDAFGFTLIELLVVVFIIGVLAAVVMPNLMGARQRARDAKRKRDLEAVKSALRMYYNDNQVYPTGNYDNLEGELVDEYIADLPEDPLEDQGYTYQQTNAGDGFLLRAVMEAPTPDGLASQESCGVTPEEGIFMVCAR